MVVSGSIEEELRARKGKALARFGQFERLWGVKGLSLKVKMVCYKAYVLPILLFGSETWALNQKQLLMLERVHTSCLRRILGVRVCDRHSNVHVREVCGIASLANILRAYRLRWLGHVCRMQEGRLPHIALFSSLYGVKKRAKRGRPRVRWEDCVSADLHALGYQGQEWEMDCQLRGVWRKKVWAISHPEAAAQQPVGGGMSGHSIRGYQQCAENQMLPFGVGEAVSLPPCNGRVLAMPTLDS